MAATPATTFVLTAPPLSLFVDIYRNHKTNEWQNHWQISLLGFGYTGAVAEETLKERHLRRGVVLQIPRFLQVSILGVVPLPLMTPPESRISGRIWWIRRKSNWGIVENNVKNRIDTI